MKQEPAARENAVRSRGSWGIRADEREVNQLELICGCGGNLLANSKSFFQVNPLLPIRYTFGKRWDDQRSALRSPTRMIA